MFTILLFTKCLQQWDGGDKPDEVCEEEKQEVVSQAGVDDNQQLGEQMSKIAKMSQKLILFCFFLLLTLAKNDPGVGPAPKS